MASLYVPSRLGSPINAGAKLYFYQTGTTTPQNTYADSALSTPNANPVVADSNGLFGPIYLLATPDYKAILKTSADVTVWTTDPLLVANASVITTRGDLIVGNSSALPARLPIGASATYLRSNGTDPSWAALAAADLTGTVPATTFPTGTVVQTVYAELLAYTTCATTTPLDDTIPQIGEGNQIFSQAITCSSTSHKVRVTCVVPVSCGAADGCCIALFRNGGSNAISATVVRMADTGSSYIGTLLFTDSPGSVSAQTYVVRVGSSANTVFVNGSTSARLFGGVMRTVLLLEEIVA